MKTIATYSVILSLILSFIPAASAADVTTEIYVSSTGSDINDGRKLSPLKTINAAKEKVRTINKDMQTDIIVNIESGTYYIDEMLDFTNEDSGYNGHKVIYRGTGETKPVLSGGTVVEGFEKTEYEGIYSAEVKADSILQMSVNSNMRYVAKGSSPIKGIISPDGTTYDYDNPDTTEKYDGLYLDKSDFDNYNNVKDVLFGWNRGWTSYSIPVDSVTENQDNYTIELEKSFYNSCRQGLTTESVDPDREFIVYNAFELLDEPGEFYYDKSKQKLYYMPFEDEDMDKATVIVPRLETIASFDGNDIDNKICNISFENITFSDTRWDFSGGFNLGQSPVGDGNGMAIMPPSAIYAERADGLNFTNNIFKNIGAIAVNFYNAVSNSTIEGNVLYDVGGTAISVSAPNHGDVSLGSYSGSGTVMSDDGVSDAVPEDKKLLPVDIAALDSTKIKTSYFNDNNNLIYPGRSHPDDDDSICYDKIHNTWAKKTISSTNVWRDDNSCKNNEKPYVIFEFQRPYSIAAVTLGFGTKISNEEKSNYEIYAANDINDEASYVSIAKVDTAKTGINEYTVDSENKFKYVIIRKTECESFAISRIWIETTDKTPYVKNERCSDISINNNVIRRVGRITNGSTAVMIFHAENTDVLHNEISEVPYTGIATGYSWRSDRPSCYNLDVGYNHIYNVCQSIHDGGAIYILGPQGTEEVYSKYHHNYIEQTNLSIHGLYTDSGVAYTEVSDNYVDAEFWVLSPYSYGSGVTSHHCVWKNNYATHTQCDYRPEVLEICEFEFPICEVAGQPSAEAYEIIKNAGLESEYSNIASLVPENTDNRYYAYDYIRGSLNSERGDITTWEPYFAQKARLCLIEKMNYMVQYATFGDGLGMYPRKYREMLKETAKNMPQSSEGDKFNMAYYDAMELVAETKASLRRYSLAQTMDICANALEHGKNNIATEDNVQQGGKYPQEAVTAFEEKIQSISISDAMTASEEYAALVEIEKAYNDFADSCYDAPMREVVIPGAYDIEIDETSNTVFAYMPVWIDLSEVEGLNFVTSKNCVIERITGLTENLKKKINIPVRCKDIQKYEIWTLQTKELPFINRSVISGDDWSLKSLQKDRILKGENSVTLPASKYAYMSRAYSDSGFTKVYFNPLSNNAKKCFSIILGAYIFDDFDYGKDNITSDCIELYFEDDEVTVYKHYLGEKTEIKTLENSNIQWNSKNELEFNVSEDKITVLLNNTTIADESVENVKGRYMGFYNPDINIRIY